jgi:hypothetical protein
VKNNEKDATATKTVASIIIKMRFFFVITRPYRADRFIKKFSAATLFILWHYSTSRAVCQALNRIRLLPRKAPGACFLPHKNV